MISNAEFRFDDKMNFDFHAPLRARVDLDDALGGIAQADLVRRLAEPELAYMFKHALVQDTTYTTLLKLDRKRLHYLVATALERAYPDRLDENAARLAQHYAEAGDEAKTFACALRAGDLAVRRYSYVEARVYYAQALQALTRLPDSVENHRLHLDTILKQMRVTRLSADPKENLALLKQAQALAQSLQGPDTLREDRLRLARMQYWSGTIHLLSNELAEAGQELEQAFAVAREFDDPGLETRVSSVLAGIITIRGQFDRAVPLLTRLLEHYEKIGNWLEWVYTLSMLGYTHAAQGHFALGLAEGERAVARARELNNPTRLVEVMATVAPIYFEGGDMPQFLAACQQTLEAAEKLGERVYTFFYVQRALVESRMGNAETALAQLTRDKASQLGRVRQTFWQDILIAFEAEIRLNAGHVEQALLLAEQAVEIAQREGNLYSGGLAERVWGQALKRLVSPRYDDADKHFAASLQLFEEGNAVLEGARTHVEWGKHLRERGADEAAREHFERAAAQFEQSGLTRELQETRALLRSIGAPE